jgi:uncharacterized protein
MRCALNSNSVRLGTLFLLAGMLLFGGLSCEVQVGGIPGQTGQVALPVRLSEPEEIRIVESIEKDRREKDLEFRQDADSPIAGEYRQDFKGASYYPIDLRYRFQGRIHRLPEGNRFQMTASNGELREAIHWGYFRFQWDQGTVCTLQVYKMRSERGEQEEFLFLPFRDKNAGKETYGGGRYLDLKENSQGIYIVDFNQAYNPYCAYGKSYSCPIPPKENNLSIAVTAGEKTFLPAGSVH